MSLFTISKLICWTLGLKYLIYISILDQNSHCNEPYRRLKSPKGGGTVIQAERVKRARLEGLRGPNPALLGLSAPIWLGQSDSNLQDWFRAIALLTWDMLEVGWFMILDILIYIRYSMPKIQQINLEIVNKLTFLAENLVLWLQGGPLGAVYAPLVVRFRPGHLNMTHGNHKGWYQQPEDHFEAVWRCYCKAPSKNGWFLGVVEKPPIMACMFLQCQDMVRTCYKS